MMAAAPEDFMPGPVTEKYTFTIVPASQVPYMWSDVSKLLAPAVKRSNGRWTLDSVFGALYAGHQQLWVGYVKATDIEIAFTTEVVDYPNARYLAIHFLGGTKLDKWFNHMLDLAERFARDHSCCGVEAPARFGFWPFVKQRGYKRAYVTYEINF